MTQLDFSFEEPAWAQALRAVDAGGTLSAVHFLTLMEGESEEALDEAFLYLESEDILLDISELPMAAGVGQAAVRLRSEQQLVKSGTLRTELEENDPLRLYLEEVDALPKNTNIRALAQRYAGGYDAAVPALTNAMLPTVVEMACALTGRGVLLLDLIQEGSLGLWQGILCYREGDFDAQVRRRIAAYMAKAVTLQARQNGIGAKMRQAVEDFRDADAWLLSELGRNPSLEEIAERIHMTADEARAVSEAIDAARALQRAKPPEKQEDSAPQEEDQRVEDTAYFRMRQRIAELLGSLEETDARILGERFGLDGAAPLSAEEVGRKLSMTAEEVTARESAALAKLREER